MSATIAAACACANTILFQSLRLHAFRGAVPHVVLVLDAHPCTQQKVLTEGYLRVIRAFNEHIPFTAQNAGEIYLTEPLSAHDTDDSTTPSLCIPLDASSRTPAGSLGLDQDTSDQTTTTTSTQTSISCSVVPFDAVHFMQDMKKLQAFLRECGQGSATFCGESNATAAAAAEGGYEEICRTAEPTLGDTHAAIHADATNDVSADTTNADTTNAAASSTRRMAFYEQYGQLRSYLQPLDAAQRTASAATSETESETDVISRLWHGVRRELLGVILIQRSAFQNEMKRYRLRLSLFDMGVRVAEHCHLESMSEAADAAAARGDVCAALGDDQVYSYARSCSLEPAVVQCFARAIADAIDVQSWRRAEADMHSDAIPAAARCHVNNDVETVHTRSHVPHQNEEEEKQQHETNDSNVARVEDGCGGNGAAAAAVAATAFVPTHTTTTLQKRRPPPGAFVAALQNDKIWQLFQRGALHWGSSDDCDTPESMPCNDSHAPQAATAETPATTPATNKAEELTSTVTDGMHHTSHDVMKQPILGPGAPLHIVCRDGRKQLTFFGGMEDCLMNTGYYVAADSAARNEVHQHRARFPTSSSPPPAAAAAAGMTGTPSRPVAEEAVHGRLKKQDYLALRKEMKLKRRLAAEGRANDECDGKAGRRAHARSSGRRSSDNDEDHDDEEEREATQRAHVVAGSCIHNSIGGTFPIGEVISESFDLSTLRGTCDVFAYPDALKNVSLCEPQPFTMTIDAGVVTEVSDGAPDDFMELLTLVRQTEGACYVRELGIGLNPFVGMSHVLADVTSFERQWGCICRSDSGIPCL